MYKDPSHCAAYIPAGAVGVGHRWETDKKLNKAYNALESNKDMEKESVDWSVDREIVVFNMVVRVGIIEKVTLE